MARCSTTTSKPTSGPVGPLPPFGHVIAEAGYGRRMNVTRRRRPVRVTLAHECELVTVGLAGLLAPYVHRVQVLPSPGGVPARGADLTLHDTLSRVQDLPLSSSAGPARRAAGRLDVERAARARRAGPRQRGQRGAVQGAAGRAAGRRPRVDPPGSPGRRPRDRPARSPADAPSDAAVRDADPARGAGHRDDHPGPGQPVDRRPCVDQHQLAQVLHPLGLPQDGRDVALAGGPVGRPARLPRPSTTATRTPLTLSAGAEDTRRGAPDGSGRSVPGLREPGPTRPLVRMRGSERPATRVAGVVPGPGRMHPGGIGGYVAGYDRCTPRARRRTAGHHRRGAGRAAVRAARGPRRRLVPGLPAARVRPRGRLPARTAAARAPRGPGARRAGPATGPGARRRRGRGPWRSSRTTTWSPRRSPPSTRGRGVSRLRRGVRPGGRPSPGPRGGPGAPRHDGPAARSPTAGRSRWRWPCGTGPGTPTWATSWTEMVEVARDQAVRRRPEPAHPSGRARLSTRSSATRCSLRLWCWE